jgi:hypothetical protein
VFSYVGEGHGVMSCPSELTVSLCESTRPVAPSHHVGVEFHVMAKGTRNSVVGKFACGLRATEVF